MFFKGKDKKDCNEIIQKRLLELAQDVKCKIGNRCELTGLNVSGKEYTLLDAILILNLINIYNYNRNDGKNAFQLFKSLLNISDDNNK